MNILKINSKQNQSYHKHIALKIVLVLDKFNMGKSDTTHGNRN